jgi:hypothetical protein
MNQVIYWVRPDFFHHNHIHQRKIKALQAAGIPASILATPTPDQVKAHRREYDRASEVYRVQIQALPDDPGTSRKARRRLQLYFAWRLLRSSRLLVQCLLVDPTVLGPLRRIPVLGSRLRVVVDYEGDLPSECAYALTVQMPGGPKEVPPEPHLKSYEWNLGHQGRELATADGVIVLTPEQQRHLEDRWKRTHRFLIHPQEIPSTGRFSSEARETLRSSLGLRESRVLLHLGGTVNPWHRFRDLCGLVGRLAERDPSIRFLGVIRSADLDHARLCVQESGISGISILLTASPEKVAGYLSASDLAIFPRHHHSMTRIVTSAKVTEYVASGLPMLGTGAHAGLNDFIREFQLELTIPGDLSVSPAIHRALTGFFRHGQDSRWRQSVSDSAMKRFGDQARNNSHYTSFCRSILEGPGLTAEGQGWSLPQDGRMPGRSSIGALGL